MKVRRVLTFMWNTGPDGHAGGFVRTNEILSRVSHATYDVIDRAPTGVSTTDHVRVLQYTLPPFVDELMKRSYALGRILDWGISCIMLLSIGLRQTTQVKYDRIYVPMSELIHTAFAAFVVGKARNIPIVFVNLNVRGVPAWPVNKLLHNSVWRIITLTRALKRELLEQHVRVPIMVNGVGVTDRSAPPQQKTADAIFVGRHTSEKGVFDLIEIWARVHVKLPEATLILVGPCNAPVKERLERLINKYQLSEVVRLLGPVEEVDKWDLYSRCSVCLFPSYVEGWGIVPVEALMSGIPVVCYDLPAYKETITDIRGVSVGPVGDITKAAEAVTQYLRLTEAERRRLSDELKDQSAHFAWAPVVEREELLLCET